MTKKLKQLHYDDIKPLRIQLHKEQDNVCPLLGIEVHIDKMVVDHQHKTQAEALGENGAGLIRGAIQFQANAFEGKVTNSYKRCGLHKMGIPLSVFLRNLADYLEQDNMPLIHPNEKPKEPKLGKREFNKLNKAYKLKYPNRKPLQYPRSKRPKLTAPWIKLFKEFDIEL